MVIYKKFINSIILTTIIITSGSYSIIEPLRYIEIIAPIILLIFLFLNRFIIQNDVIFQLLIFLFFFIFLRALIDLNFKSLFAFRFLSSIIIFLAFFLLSSCKKYFSLYPVTFFLLLILLFEIEVYKYFWEFSYLFSISLVTLLFFNNYIFVFFNLLILFFLGQRTIILVLAYLFFSKFFNLISNFKTSLILIITISIVLVILNYWNLSDRAFRAFINFEISSYFDTFLLFLQDAPNYSYNDFIFKYKRDTLLLARELDQDFSLLLRFKKWSHAIANSNFITFLFGLGPGYFGKAADSGWLRLFFEYGILIFIIISFLLNKLINMSNPIQKTILVVFIIFNIFVDIMFAPLLMGFTGFILGLTRNRNEIFYK